MAVSESDRSKSLTRVAATAVDLEPLIRRSLRRVIDQIVAENDLPTAEETRALVAAMNPTGLRRLILLWQHEVARNIRPGFLAAIHRAQTWTLGRLPPAVDTRLGPNIRDVRAQALMGTIENRLVGIGDTMYHEATQALQISLENGEGVQKAAARVRHSLDVSEARSRTIARTEAAAVVNGADQTIAEELTEAGVVTIKEWLATNDPRTRESHVIADRQRVPTDQPFLVGEGPARLMYPGDPTGPADEVIQCRCTTLLDVEDESLTRWEGAP